MITIRFRDKTTTPATERVETLPEDAKLEMVFTLDEIGPFLEKVEINGETFRVEGISDPLPITRILKSVFRRP